VQQWLSDSQYKRAFNDRAVFTLTITAGRWQGSFHRSVTCHPCVCVAGDVIFSPLMIYRLAFWSFRHQTPACMLNTPSANILTGT